MKNFGKILAIAAVVGGLVYVASNAGRKGTVSSEGSYENKGQTAYWEIRSDGESNYAYVKFPGNDWAEIGSNYGSPDPLGQMIDSRMRENGYLPPGQEAPGEDAAQASFSQGTVGG